MKSYFKPLRRTIGVLTVALGCLLFGGWIFRDSICEYLGSEQFDRVRWRGPKNLDDQSRIRMVDDLLRRHNFNGMTREQLVEILGESDETTYFKDWDFVYWLGDERGWMSIDSEWLVIRLDDASTFSEYRIVRD